MVLSAGQIEILKQFFSPPPIQDYGEKYAGFLSFRFIRRTDGSFEWLELFYFDSLADCIGQTVAELQDYSPTTEAIIFEKCSNKTVGFYPSLYEEEEF